MEFPKTPQEARQELNKLSRDIALIRHAEDAAWHFGWSGEDKYAVLALAAIQETERHRKLVLDFIYKSPTSKILVEA